jgi:hypothetical protein
MILLLTRAMIVVSLLGAPQGWNRVSDSTSSINGTIAPRGINCPRIKLEDGKLASLMGVSSSLTPGTKVRLEGQWVKRSTCQQGPTFQATAVHILKY